MKIVVEEHEGRSFVLGQDLHVEINEDGTIIIDCDRPVRFKGRTMKKLDELPTATLNAVCAALDPTFSRSAK